MCVASDPGLNRPLPASGQLLGPALPADDHACRAGMSCPVSTSVVLGGLVGGVEDRLECSVVGGVVGDAVVPAAPDDVCLPIPTRSRGESEHSRRTGPGSPRRPAGRSRRRPSAVPGFGLASSVSAAYQVPDLAFHLGSGGPVLGPSGRDGLGGAGPGQLGLAATDREPPQGRRGGALGGQRATPARGHKRRGTAAGLDGPARRGDAAGAGHAARGGLDFEAALGKRPPGASGGWTFAEDVGAGRLQVGQRAPAP